MQDEARFMSVSDLTRTLGAVIRSSLPAVKVRAEIGSFTKASSGHWYFNLKDDSAQIRAVMFRQSSIRVGFLPKIGDQVEVLAVPSIYEPRGELQLIVETLRKSGQGSLYEQFLKLKAKLQADGLFELARKKPLPRHVFSVGVVTSPQAAAWADIQTAMARRVPHIRFRLYPSAVQGEQAASQLAAALKEADDAGHDVVIMGRGGGSLEDLWCFNEETVVRAVAACRTPTIVGVGHESDVCLSEFAADVRAATPTAAVELCSAPTAELLEQLETLQGALRYAADRTLERLMQRTDRAELRLVSPQDRLKWLARTLNDHQRQLSACVSDAVARDSRCLDSVWPQLQRSVQDSVRQFNRQTLLLSEQMNRGRMQAFRVQQTRLQSLASLCEAVSPQRNLEKGYSILRRRRADGTAGAVLKSAVDAAPGQMIAALLSDGELNLEVKGESDSAA